MNRKVASLFVALFCFPLAFSEKVLAGESEMVGGVPNGRPVTPTAAYSGVRCDRLVSVFVRSYTKSGFSLKSRKKKGRDDYELAFEFDALGIKGGQAYSIYSSRERSCSVVGTTGGPYSTSVSAEKWEGYWERLEVADRKARLLIRSKLGKSPVWDCGSFDKCSDGVGCCEGGGLARDHF